MLWKNGKKTPITSDEYVRLDAKLKLLENAVEQIEMRLNLYRKKVNRKILEEVEEEKADKEVDMRSKVLLPHK